MSLTSTSEGPLFALIPGSWHTAEHMQPLEAALQARGQRVISLNLPSGPDANLSVVAEHIAVTLADEPLESVVGYFASRGGNSGPRAVNLLTDSTTGRSVFERMMFGNAGFDESTCSAFGRSLNDKSVPRKYNPESRKAIQPRPDLGPNMTSFDPARAQRFLYNSVKDQRVVDAAIRNLQDQLRQEDGTALNRWPNVGSNFFIGMQDEIIEPDYSLFVAKDWFGAEPYVYEDGDHSLHASKPDELADDMIAALRKPGSYPIAVPDASQRRWWRYPSSSWRTIRGLQLGRTSLLTHRP